VSFGLPAAIAAFAVCNCICDAAPVSGSILTLGVSSGHALPITLDHGCLKKFETDQRITGLLDRSGDHGELKILISWTLQPEADIALFKTGHSHGYGGFGEIGHSHGLIAITIRAIAVTFF
jgi:hypothetical protein